MSQVNLNVDSTCSDDVTVNVKFTIFPSDEPTQVHQIKEETTTPGEILEKMGKNPDKYSVRINHEKRKMDTPIPAGTTAVFFTKKKGLDGA